MEAAQVLDEIEEDLDDLNKKLIEYKEMPRLPGDCDLQLGIDE